MSRLDIAEFVQCGHGEHEYSMEDYEADTPRWCKGCGDLGVLSSVQKILREKQTPPEKVVCVSGIGCSSRFPHYLGTYGFHGIHGRAFTLATGVALSRPDLKVLTVMGDGDCFSIGAGHWVHALRYNVDLTAIVLDNEIYALTKKQASPTTPQGTSTNTTPGGSYLEGLNPLSVCLGITNISFVAQTATWLAGHCEATLRRAWEHKGLSFVRVLQRCPVFMPKAYGEGGKKLQLSFLKNEDGIPPLKGFMKESPEQGHDHTDLAAAQKLALQTDPAPIGLLYCNPDLPSYQEVRYQNVANLDNDTMLEKLNAKIGEFVV
jgi:2-oxoglutarate ferredoxin oxidoreductase subunit beta